VKRSRLLTLLPLLLFVVSCASLSPEQIPFSFERPNRCQEFFDQLDEKVNEAGVRNVSSFPVPGFPYLRTNRFFSAFRNNLKDEKERELWVQWMKELSVEARKKEISNLPDLEKIDQEKLLSQLEACSPELLNHDKTRSNFYQTLLPLVKIPDEYSCLRRGIGLYPLISLPVALATQNSREKIRRRFETSLSDLPADGSLKSFVPEKKAFLQGEEIEGMIKEYKKNPFGASVMDKYQENKLAQSFAPVFIQDVAAPYDRIGKVVWKGNRLEIDPEKPTVYYYISHAFLKGEPILQINYVIWYEERAGKRSPWIERGHLDGLTARISLDSQRRPFMVDVVNDCGCYHFFSPEKERVAQVLSKTFQFDPFVPQWLPTVPQGKRFGIRINSGWHQVERLLSVEETPDSISYELVPYDVLEALPHENGRTESIFDSKGIVKGSERVERFILFSMGISSIGSMRQRGHHAIELIGRTHFDDPFLFDKSFMFK